MTDVEWVFGDILSYFAFLDFKKNLALLAQCNLFVAYLEMLLHVFMVRLHLITIQEYFQILTTDD